MYRIRSAKFTDSSPCSLRGASRATPASARNLAVKTSLLSLPKHRVFTAPYQLFFIGGKNSPRFSSSSPEFLPFAQAQNSAQKILSLYCKNQALRPSLVATQRKEADTQLATEAEREVVTQPSEFSRLFETHHGMIFRTAYRITGNAADAEDVLQTIFLRLLRQPAGAFAASQEESYFRRAAVNASLDIIRQKQSARSVPINEAALSSTASPSSDRTTAQDCLRRALKTLTPRSAEIFALRYFEDFTNPQIAGALNISQVLVAVSLHRSRRQLQKEIRNCLEGAQ